MPIPAIEYADYAAWQRRWLDGEALEAQGSYWKQTLSGAPASMEPAHRLRTPCSARTRADVFPFHLNRRLTRS